LDLEDEGSIAVSDEVVKLLTSELKNKSAKIREIALLELGNIGQPEAKSAADSVVKCLSDSDSSIRSAACWTLSRICDQQPKRAEAKLT
jgi:HEAT repeat protein